MKNEILLALAAQWELDAQTQDAVKLPQPDSLATDHIIERRHVMCVARRETKRECADTLRMLVSILADS